jgi:D-tyrosyl-tRNA(Tyr) deacylase
VRAEAVVRRFGVRLSELGFQVEEGRFGAHMQVSLVNDGPFTILLESPIER